MFTDEATFTRREVFNWRNSDYWEEENPHAIKARHFQHEFKLNIWCGIIGDQLLGPMDYDLEDPGNAPQNYQQPQPNYGYPPQQQTPQPIIMMQPPTQTSTSVTVNTSGGIGVGCPVCHNNSWTGSYSCCAWCLAIVCFPIGIICCCCMRRKKCTKCGYTVG
ncbi:unnamed protein product [Diabrotica balteata]|uniref:Membrane protein BRI3 n=1 Tax=Diabrotica balteata TaxID=107213 RepID=A0A9N9T824_DIABA|nr:unnamed protein product [Diabrotica balteata]